MTRADELSYNKKQNIIDLEGEQDKVITIPERKERESAKEYVVRVLVDNIVNTGLEPGEKLIEQELCEKLGVSRTPFREAELELAQRKLIDIRPKIGTYVAYIDAELVRKCGTCAVYLRQRLQGWHAVCFPHRILTGCGKISHCGSFISSGSRRIRYSCWTSSFTVCSTICVDGDTGMNW